MQHHFSPLQGKGEYNQEYVNIIKGKREGKEMEMIKSTFSMESHNFDESEEDSSSSN